MIYKCEDCVNRNNCSENKAQYTTLCKVIEAVLKLDKEEEFHSWFGLTMKCDYFVAERRYCECECDGGDSNG